MHKLPKPGVKYDTDKLRYDLLDWDFIDEVVRVLMAGAAEYGEYSWRKVKNGRLRYWNALGRHWRKARKELIDPQHGTAHLAHVAANAMFIYYFLRTGTGKTAKRRCE